jgi:hypothetical protein
MRQASTRFIRRTRRRSKGIRTAGPPASVPLAAVAQLAPPLLPLSAALFAYTAIPSLTGAYNVLFKERRLGVAARPDVARNSMPPGEEVRFAVDSPVEEADSNRRSLPVNELVSQAGMRMRARRQGWSRTRRPCSGTTGSNPLSSSGESGEIHERACGAKVQSHPVHRKPAMKLVPRPGFVSIDRSAPGDPGADEIKRSDF